MNAPTKISARTTMWRLLTASATTLLFSCMIPPEEIATRQDPAPQPFYGVTEDMSYLFEQYFLESLELNPRSGISLGMQKYNSRWVNFFSEQHRQKTRNFNRKWTQRVAEARVGQMDAHDRTSVEILEYLLAQAIERERFPTHLVPINQFNNFANSFARSGSGQAGQPFSTTRDYDNWQQRARGIPVIIDQSISNMREGVTKGVVQPRVLMEKVLPQLQAQIVAEAQASTFWQPINNFPDSVATTDRDRLSAEFRTMIMEQIVPAYARLHDYIRDEYLPATRESVGISAMPDGAAWYQYLVKRQTTTDMTPAEIHKFGLEEVARILGEMNEVREEVRFSGSLAEFFTFMETNENFYWQNEADLIAGYQILQTEINELLPKLFNDFPRTDYEIHPVEAFRAQSAAGASYQRSSPDSSRPGRFYVNTYNLKAQPKFGMETLSLHEASPGHHFQITIQQEIQNLPMFRAFGGFSVFSEGWALYAESLGKELGVFTDPYQYFGRLSDEMLRAMRLVVDTGLHANGWSRERAIQYMLDNSTLAESDVIAEVERYMAIPAQALSYKIGQRIISDLRDKAEQQLGENFDIKGFHSLILRGGSMPMANLEKRVNHWIQQEQSR